LMYNKRQTVALDDGESIEIRPAGLSISQAFAGSDDVLDLLERCVMSWTYKEPLTREMLGELDTGSAAKVINAINQFGNETAAASKNA